MGTAGVEAWPVVLTLRHFTDLLLAAGYGGEQWQENQAETRRKMGVDP
jgi:hypothetical protein